MISNRQLFYVHLFRECPFDKSVWNVIGNWMKKISCFLNQDFLFLSCSGSLKDATNLLFHHVLLIMFHNYGVIYSVVFIL